MPWSWDVSITFTANNAFNWAQLVQQACINYSVIQTAAPTTLEYFGKIFNIVYASSKGTGPCCTSMFTHYELPGYLKNWTGSFVQYVFNY